MSQLWVTMYLDQLSLVWVLIGLSQLWVVALDLLYQDFVPG